MNLMQNFKEVFKALKRRSPLKIFCPKCGGADIHLSSSFDGWLTPKKYVCESCGYIGPIIMELSKDECEKRSVRKF